jgi:hypothetical protein
MAKSLSLLHLLSGASPSFGHAGAKISSICTEAVALSAMSMPRHFHDAGGDHEFLRKHGSVKERQRMR